MKIVIIGTAGIPANYGGFETLVQNLAEFHLSNIQNVELLVYCSSKNHSKRPPRYLNTELRYLPISANGISSIPYDIWSLIKASLNRSDTLLILGVSGAIALPVVKLLSRARIVTNIDGIEWQREKWRGLARWFLRISEKFAVSYSDTVIADNDAIADYVKQTYGISPTVIAYGGDHAVQSNAASDIDFALPENYAFSVCRIEPENNIHLILDAFSRRSSFPLVIVGNWENSSYGQDLKCRFGGREHLHLLNPIYDAGILKHLRSNAKAFVHGHSAGGTNPSLVEAMHFGKAILMYDCNFNRCTTENNGLFFKDATDLYQLICDYENIHAETLGLTMREIAERRYTWTKIARSYFNLPIPPA
jgi:glycosyltransferase involved in cell wall biosynthesis